MGINVGETLMGLVTTSGVYQYLTNPLALIMVAIACVLLYLAIVKQFEPLLLLPIAFGMLLTNLLGSDIFHEELFAGGHANWALFGGAVMIDGKDFVDSVGYMVNAAGQILTSNNVVLGHFVNAVTIDDPTSLVPFADILAQFAANGNAASIILEDAFLKNGAVYTATGAMLATAGKTISAGLLDYLYLGVKLGIYPCLIFMGVGAGTDFGPLISNPKTLLLGAAAQLGIFMTFIFAYAVFGFSAAEAGAIGIIGGADGPTAIWLTGKLAPHLLGPIAVAAYSYMALVPVIQPADYARPDHREGTQNRHGAAQACHQDAEDYLPHCRHHSGCAAAAVRCSAGRLPDAGQPREGMRRDRTSEQDDAERADEYRHDFPRHHGRRNGDCLYLPDGAHA